MKKKIGILVGVIVGIIIFAMGIWKTTSYKPDELATEALISDSKIDVKNNNYISFIPKDINSSEGFIFYPGGGVEPESYAPLCKEIALQGYTVVIAKMPLNLAVLSPNEADKIIKEYDNIDTWAIGGHSLGGVMASKYASTHEDIKGLALYASYPSEDELKKSDLEIISIYGSEDGIVNQENLADSKYDLPKDAKFIEIDGGNHSQFGDYGLQKGDNKATIDANNQIGSTVNYTVELLDKIK